ncbi:hypothetical protein [Streptomyces sp. NPDC127084]|uniref:hypothetical protein n=1 Tax=Streptomyces sp. NPDC127084 TaxID=3347133 RepID=UPI0036647162
MDFSAEETTLKVVNGRLVSAEARKGARRPAPPPSCPVFREHSEEFSTVEVSLPWLKPDGPLVTKRLFFSLTGGGAVRRTDFNTRVWKFALIQVGFIPEPKEGGRHQAAREHGMHALRHFYASLLLDAGENIKALIRGRRFDVGRPRDGPGRVRRVRASGSRPPALIVDSGLYTI